MTHEEFEIYYFCNVLRIRKIVDALEAGDHDRGLKYAKYAYEMAQELPEQDWSFYDDGTGNH